jgi:hypothetical protein
MLSETFSFPTSFFKSAIIPSLEPISGLPPLYPEIPFASRAPVRLDC